MEHTDNDVDLLLAEARELIAKPEDQSSYKKGKTAKKSAIRIILGVFGKLLCVLLETVLLAAVALYGVMFVLAKGPSPTARDIFVLSVRETSAVGFLANLFFTDEEIAQIEAGGNTIEFEDMDTSLIVMPKPTQPHDSQQGPKPDEWGLVDEDGDGIIIDPVKGEGFSGYMMVVLDPSRVIMASKPEAFGHRGYTVAQMVEEFDAVAGINAGGFYDPNGQGNGSIPDTMVIYDGQIYYPEFGSAAGFVGIDNNHIMHVGRFTASQVKDKNIQYGVGFGPVLIANGEAIPNAASGVNPRTGIGQRSDGAILMLVIDGRQVTSLGATYQDMTEIFFSYGAVNACNLDGGSSSMMWYQGGYINNCASVVGIRPVPTTFLVLKEGVGNNG
ncbi:MAG: phosphodiester glycosidase family protein [Oscillospiraceae bacterium]|nr:phosphodiester glycosidase family protein [Oscillospiraceae bacterium]